jgi:hypothetical protein
MVILIMMIESTEILTQITLGNINKFITFKNLGFKFQSLCKEFKVESTNGDINYNEVKRKKLGIIWQIDG